MTVRIYPVFEHFVPAVKVDGKIVPVVLGNRRRWDDPAELQKALENRGYAYKSGLWEYEGQPEGAKGRPATETLEEQASRRSSSDRH